MSNLPLSTVYVELDALLDTRMGVLAGIDSDKFAKLLSTGYHYRFKDEFEGYDMAQFYDVYDKRDVYTLMNSQFTNVLKVVADFVEKTLVHTLRTPFHKNPKIEVNVHPYKLDVQAQSDIARAIAFHTGEKCDVEVVCYTPEQLNPVFVRERYELMFMYDAGSWLEVQAKAGHWEKYSCPNVVIRTPMMVKNRETVLTNNIFSSIVDDMDKMAELCSVFVQLLFVPVHEFSWAFNPLEVTNEEREEATKMEQDTNLDSPSGG